MQPSPDSRLGDYRLLQLVGSGMGNELWSAVDSAQRRVTLQCWSGGVSGAVDELEEFLELARKLTAGSSEGAVPVRGHFIHAGAPVVVLEAPELTTLGSYLQRHGSLPLHEVVSLLRPVCRALLRAHGLGRAHGSLSPHRIVVDSQTLTGATFDFGANRLASALRTGTMVVKDRPFRAPEVRADEAMGSLEADTWALGAVLYACLTGGMAPPPEAGLAVRTLNESTANQLLVPELPFDVDALLRELLAEDPAQRLVDLQKVDEVLAGYSEIPPESLAYRAAQGTCETTLPDLAFPQVPYTSVIDARFQPLGEEREGGMGRILRSLDLQTREEVAVKLLFSHNSVDTLARFEREARLLASMEHPALVRFVKNGITETGESYLAMEWLEGQDLMDYLEALNPTPDDSEGYPPRATSKRLMSFDDVVTLGYRIASVTGLLHDRGVVHRDIKPANIFIVGDRIEQCKLLDLGVASLANSDAGLTQSGDLVGTPAYMSPEQAQPTTSPGSQADVWAIGCVMYECLTGQRAFPGQNLMAVLAKIVLDAPVPLLKLRPDTPSALAMLIDKTLSRDPLQRPRDGKTLARALAALMGTVHHRSESVSATLPPNSLTMREQRFGCVLLVEKPPPGVERDELKRCAESNGGDMAALMDGSLLCTPSRAITIKDDAITTARIALALGRLEPGLKMGVAIGRISDSGRDAQTGASFGAAIDHMARLLTQADAGQISLDDATAPLLEPHFQIGRKRDIAVLGGEREAESTRTLLGQPSAWVGRRREMQNLVSLFDEVVENGAARAIVVTAPAGMGKTRLGREYIKELRRGEERFELLVGQGDSISAGSPFVMLAPAIRKLAGIVPGESLEARERKLLHRIKKRVPEEEAFAVAAFLGEMVGVPFANADESLVAARNDPMLMGERTRTAWERWLGCECEAGPVVLLLEDLHWGDLPSVNYVGAALAALRDKPLLVVALARPEVREIFPELWAKAEPETVLLRGLSQRACQSLVRGALGDEVDPEVEAMIIERAEGNAFFLEELIRMVSDGVPGQIPATVLSMVQSRLDAFGGPVKRALRAASVFGEVFWRGGVESLIGEVQGAFSLDESLESLVRGEVLSLVPTSRFFGEREYKFRHALLRDGAYESLTAHDRALGHRLAAQWLEAAGEGDALVLAEHCHRGEDADNAGRWFQAAAEHALDANDLATVVRCCERAVECQVSGRRLGSIRALEANAAYWQSDYDRSARCAGAAAPLLHEGGPIWFQALGTAIVSYARLADYDAVDHWLERALEQPALQDARSEQLICLCRGAFQLVFGARFDEADRVLERISDLMVDVSGLGALALAQAHHVQGVRAAHVGDVAKFLSALRLAITAFERAGDKRNVRLETTTLAWCHAELGEFGVAERICRSNLEECQRIGAQQAVTYAKVNLGYILAATEARRDEARSMLEQAIAECGEVANQRLSGWARTHLAGIEYANGRLTEAAQQATLASVLLAGSPGLMAWARATYARILLALNRPQEALTEARAAMETLERLGGLLQGESLPPLVLALSLDAVGEKAAARGAIAIARERLLARADRLGDDDWKRSFLSLPDSVEILGLAEVWCG